MKNMREAPWENYITEEEGDQRSGFYPFLVPVYHPFLTSLESS